MKNKLWPYSIILVLVLFGAFIISFVVRSMKTDVQLVRPDYYNHEINYQQQIAMESNSQTLSDKFSMNYNNLTKRLTISIPDTLNVSRGTIIFYRPSDKSLDFIQNMRNYKAQTVDLSKIKKGLWQVQIQFESKTGNSYYKEKDIFIE